MADDQYETRTVTCQGRDIDLSYRANWLNTGQWHLELRCSGPLPVTQTGYRSAFVATDEIPETEAITGYVLEWLDHAAADKSWQRYLEDERQLKLF